MIMSLFYFKMLVYTIYYFNSNSIDYIALIELIEQRLS